MAMKNLTFKIIALLTLVTVSACSSPSDSAFSDYDYTDLGTEGVYAGGDLSY
jgi:hypothetical protein